MTARRDTEHQHQKALFDWAARMESVHPQLKLMFAIPNGGHRDKRVAKKLKAEGVKAGVFDICLPVARLGFHALYIELKRPQSPGVSKGRVTGQQLEWQQLVNDEGNCAVICWGWESARVTVLTYLGA